MKTATCSDVHLRVTPGRTAGIVGCLESRENLRGAFGHVNATFASPDKAVRKRSRERHTRHFRVIFLNGIGPLGAARRTVLQQEQA